MWGSVCNSLALIGNHVTKVLNIIIASQTSSPTQDNMHKVLGLGLEFL